MVVSAVAITPESAASRTTPPMDFSTTSTTSRTAARRAEGRRRPQPPTAGATARPVLEIDEQRAMGRDRLFRRSLAVADAASALVALALSVSLFGDHLKPGMLLVVPLLVLAGKIT